MHSRAKFIEQRYRSAAPSSGAVPCHFIHQRAIASRSFEHAFKFSM